MNKLRLWLITCLAPILSACSSHYFPTIEQNLTPAQGQAVQTRSMHLTDREIRIITALEDRFYEGHFDGVVESVDKDRETKMGSLGYLNETIKLKAFSECLGRSTERCAESFRRILHNQADFELTEAEVSHPIWGPVFQAEKNKFIERKLDAAVNAVHSMNAQFIVPAEPEQRASSK